MAFTTLYAATARRWKSVTQTLLLATVFVTASASAENFVKVTVEPDPLFPDRDAFYIDLDSFKPDVSTKSTYFTYRRAGKSFSDSKTVTLEYDAIASCEKFALVNLRTYGFGPGSKFLTDERYTDEKGWLQDPQYQTKYLNKAPESAMLFQVCQHVYSQVVEAMMSRPKDGYLDRGTLNYTLFALGDRNRYNLRLVTGRIDLVGEYCGNLPFLQERLAVLLKDVETCGDRTDCFLRREGGLAHGVAEDAQRISEWLLVKRSLPLDKEKACKTEVSVASAQRYQRELEEKWAAEKKAGDALWSCIDKQAKDLDDGISDSATIAKVVYRACDSQVHDVLEVKKTAFKTQSRDEYYVDAETKIIEAVLKNRAKKRKR